MGILTVTVFDVTVVVDFIVCCYVVVVSDLGRINPGRSYGESRQTTETHLWNGRELMGTLCQIQLVKIATWLLFY